MNIALKFVYLGLSKNVTQTVKATKIFEETSSEQKTRFCKYFYL